MVLLSFLLAAIRLAFDQEKHFFRDGYNYMSVSFGS